MAVGYDGSIRIDSRIDTKGFNVGINRMVSSLKKLAVAIGIAFGTTAIISLGKSSVKATTELTNAMTGLKSILDGQGRSFKNAQKFINEYVSDGLIPATNAITAYKNLASRGYTDTQIEQVLIALKDSAAFGRQASYSLGDAVMTASEGLRNENSILVDNAGVTKNVAKMWEDYAKSIGTTTNNLTKQQKIQAEVTGILEETRFQTGDAAKVAKGYSGEVLRLGFNFNNLRIAVGNALLPIAWAVLPSINAIIAALTKLANVFAQVTTAIFGKQAKQQDEIAKTGISAAKAQDKLADATKEAGKEAKGALAGFDELNVLAENTADAASGASGGLDNDLGLGDIATGGEIGAGVTVSPAVQSAIDTIMKMLEPLKSINFDNLNNSFDSLKKAIEPITKAVFSGIEWAYINIFIPLAKWTIEDFLPAFFHVLASAIDVVTESLKAFKPLAMWLWEDFLKPAAEWTGGMIIAILESITEAFKILSTWINKTASDISIFIIPTISNLWKTSKQFRDDVIIMVTKLGELFKVVWERVIKPVWDNFMQVVDWLWSKHLKPLLINITGFVNELILCAMKIINEFILPIVTEFVERFGPPIAFVFNTIVNVISTSIAMAIDIINGIITVLKGIVQFLTGVFTGDWKKAWEGIVNIFKGIFQGIAGIVKGIVNNIIDIINSMIKVISAGLNFVINKLNSFKVSIPDWVSKITGITGTWSLNIPTIPAYTIPKLATGAVIPPNSEFLAILGDQKSGRNIEAPEGLIRQIIKEELSGLNTGGQEVTINFGGNMAQLIRVLKPYIDKENSRIGTKLVIGGAQ